MPESNISIIIIYYTEPLGKANASNLTLFWWAVKTQFMKLIYSKSETPVHEIIKILYLKINSIKYMDFGILFILLKHVNIYIDKIIYSRELKWM